MKYTVYDRLLKREVGQQRRQYTDIRGIYGDKRWVDDLDIVNELEGHSGCVNALSWSTSGRLLASGSDDHRVNIYSYKPESSTSQFSLTTSILTGHRSNIFSVKFMPYSNDRTIVSATDDVRIFDIEHSGHSPFGTSSRSNDKAKAKRVDRDSVVLTESDTNAKAFRCHTETVKRIVTEDNPFYFLTCSNDGDVRQWDIRQPAKAYPRAKDSMIPSWAQEPSASNNVPAPLISYRRHGLDLNTISCSPSQPHYIALGGAHLHCFLHDRRMLGRDKLNERGAKVQSSTSASGHDEDFLGQATQCVKKFAPNGKRRMRQNDGGHITACKISDAFPNELLVSWSQDHIYSFDILRAPDASEHIQKTKSTTSNSPNRAKDQTRKRKRAKPMTSSQEDTARAESRQRTGSPSDLALRVRYGNGQSEDIRIEAPVEQGLTEAEMSDLRGTDHFRIAQTTIRMARRLFDLDDHGENGLRLAFTSLLGFAHSILPDIDDISRTWGYPVDPDAVDVAVQKKLRDDRAATRRFVQATGTLARAMGGQLLTGSTSDTLISQYFASLQPAPRERNMPRHEQFGYDFLKAILLWLDSGPGAIVEGFSSRSCSSRLPIPQDSDIDAIEDILIPYLADLASEKPVVDVDVSRFEADDTRILYACQTDALRDFARALKIPFADLTGASADSSPSEAQDRETARRKWAFKVGRSILLNVAEDLTFAVIDRAFGGRGVADSKIKAMERFIRTNQTDIDPSEDEEPITDVEPIEEEPGETQANSSDSADGISSSSTAQIVEDEEIGDEDTDGDAESSDEEEDSESDNENGEGLRRTRSGRMLWRSEFGRSRFKREKVGLDVPCAPHTRVYRGHCNVKTVKDVNYFGLQDDYVVSGSDSGHVFIWDRKTAELVNILQGDGEVVNVVQGHPYEPTMAVSGIDHTIKVFSSDLNDQRNARLGIGVQCADPMNFSSLRWDRQRERRSEPTSPEESDKDDVDDTDEEQVANNGLASRKCMDQAYRIISKNDMDRKGGRDDYFISQAVFAQLARHLAANRGGGAGDGEEGEHGPIVLTEENCTTM